MGANAPLHPESLAGRNYHSVGRATMQWGEIALIFYFLGSGGKRWVAHRPWVQVSMACFCVAEQEVSQPAARPNLPGRKKKKRKPKKLSRGGDLFVFVPFFAALPAFFSSWQNTALCQLPC